MKSGLSASGARALVLSICALFIFAVAGEALGQEALTAKALEGVWKITKVAKTGANMGADVHPQPSLLIFYRGYYSVIRDNSSEPRKPSPRPKDPKNLTEAEKIARYEEWAPFMASGGTYEVEGGKVITHNVVAKQVNGMTLTEEAMIQFDGDTFDTISPNGDKYITYTRVR
ncbi:MAG: hypothetical protein JO369_04165 [Paucibacter sp.]|nr:hypothetical protein [Roseateles sp.]